MKLSKQTLEVLSNFSNIDQTLKIDKDSNVISTINQKDTAFIGKAMVEETFPEEVRIYELQRFLPTISIFDDPDFEFLADRVIVSEPGKGSVEYFYFDKSIGIKRAPDIKAFNPDAAFRLTADILKRARTSANVMQLPHIAIVGDGSEITIRAIDIKKPNSNRYGIPVGFTSQNFSFVYPKEKFMLLGDDYDVSCTKNKAITYLKATTKKIEYWIAGDRTLSTL